MDLKDMANATYIRYEQLRLYKSIFQSHVGHILKNDFIVYHVDNFNNIINIISLSMYNISSMIYRRRRKKVRQLCTVTKNRYDNIL
jgi:hypothetical protein